MCMCLYLRLCMYLYLYLYPWDRTVWLTGSDEGGKFRWTEPTDDAVL